VIDKGDENDTYFDAETDSWALDVATVELVAPTVGYKVALEVELEPESDPEPVPAAAPQLPTGAPGLVETLSTSGPGSG
jgi:hypothetical protein